ncbi:hypothetical protein DSM112329_04604 [Paraconexibacter sp. AEG42_29]|uniref:Protein SirB1 N-terminal domain-containing protein n=1 Tax=Paraconexibacter sp. AEG42_29 TaxID=2997339 RepID=A0AAU7B2F0_9ACTN
MSSTDPQHAPFGRVVALHDPSLEAIAWALVGALGGDTAARLHARTSVLAQRLDGVGSDPALQLDALSGRVACGFAVPRRAAPDLEDLLPDRVLESRSGTALTVALLVAVVGQRRGWDVEIVCGKAMAFVAHRRLDHPLVCSPQHDGRLIDARDVEDGDLWRMCAHEVADTLLARIAGRARGIARHDLATRALELSCVLPGTPQDIARRQMALTRARSAFN